MNELSVPLDEILDNDKCNLIEFQPNRALSKLQRQPTKVVSAFDEFKTNFDGVVFEETNESGISVVEIMAALSEKIPLPFFIVVLETLAAWIVAFERDSKIVINALRHGDMSRSSIGHLVKTLHLLLFLFVSVHSLILVGKTML